MAMILPPHPIDRAHDKVKKSIESSLLIKKSLSEFLFTADNFFNARECQSWIQYCISAGFVEVDSNGSRDYAKRNQGRLQIDSTETASAIFQRLLPIIPTVLGGRRAIGCSSNIRIYRYLPGQCFGKHIDESNRDPEGRGSTQLTVLVYLNGEDSTKYPETVGTRTIALLGGHTIFYHDPPSKFSKKNIQKEPEVCAIIIPETGKVVLHAHGDRCLTHEAAVVVQGVKYVLRTDVVYG